MSRIIALAIFLTGAPTFLVQAQMEPGPGRDGQTQELVDQLKEVIRGVEQDRRSNPSMTISSSAIWCAGTIGHGELRFFMMIFVTGIIPMILDGL
jgi:hypothetical protein